MDVLYKKLYAKYSKSKTEYFDDFEEMSRNQEAKFLNFVQVADQAMAELRSENEKLSREVSELRDEIYSISSTNDEKCMQYQKLLMEEDRKNGKLLEEIERLRNGDKLECGLQSTLTSSTPVLNSKTKPGPSSNSNTVRMTRKRARELDLCSENRTRVAEEVTMPDPLSDTDNRPHKQTKVDETLLNSCLPPCCRRKTSDSGNDATETVPVSCKFQDLVECVVGLQLSTNPENDEFSISVSHPSSGYSFSLTWVNTSNGEPEFRYKVLSLGTFERIAPDWMRDILMFSPRMCSVFFERLSRVLKLNR